MNLGFPVLPHGAVMLGKKQWSLPSEAILKATPTPNPGVLGLDKIISKFIWKNKCVRIVKIFEK